MQASIIPFWAITSEFILIFHTSKRTDVLYDKHISIFVLSDVRGNCTVACFLPEAAKSVVGTFSFNVPYHYIKRIAKSLNAFQH